MLRKTSTSSLRAISGLFRSSFFCLACVLCAAGHLSAQDIDPRRSIVKPDHIELKTHHRRDAVMVKFRDGLLIRATAGRLSDRGSNVLAMANQVLAGTASGRWHPIFSLPEPRLNTLRRNAEHNRGRAVCDLNLWFYLFLGPGGDAQAAINALLPLEIVELALPVDIPPPPPLPPDFQDNQGYLDDSLHGIGAISAWETYGQRGAGVAICDVEYSWNFNHLDLPAASLIGPEPLDPFNSTNHGTAVLGILAAIDNGWGTTGIAPDVQLLTSAANIEIDGASVYDMPGAIMRAVNVLQPGDIILIEQQAAGPRYTGVGQFGLVPSEWRLPTYDAIVTAVGNGIIVVEAGGNGEEDLDDWVYGFFHEPFTPEGDSGAFIIGAGTQNGFEASFTNFGSTVDLQGWGSGIWTTGYGNAHNTEGLDLLYMKTFGGTSGASAMVAGVCALFQSNYQAITGNRLTPAEMKQWLQQSGTPQSTRPSGDVFNIGPRPNAFNAIDVSTRPIHITLLDPLPVYYPPGQPLPLRVEIIDGLDSYVAGTGKLQYRFGTGEFQMVSLVPEPGSSIVFLADLPEVYCDEQPQFFFEAMAGDGSLSTDPSDAPNSVHSFFVGELTTTTWIDEGFENGLPLSWTGTGLWHVANGCDPAASECGGSQWAYFGQDVLCNYNIGMAFGDLSLPTLLLPPPDLSSTTELTICHWVETEGLGGVDRTNLLVDGSVQHSFTNTGGWQTEIIDLAYFQENVALKFRFDSVDTADNAYPGWLIDHVTVTRESFECNLQRPCPADCYGGDRQVDVLDLIAVLVAWGTGDPVCDIAPEGNLDGLVNAEDLLILLINWGSCTP